MRFSILFSAILVAKSIDYNIVKANETFFTALLLLMFIMDFIDVIVKLTNTKKE